MSTKELLIGKHVCITDSGNKSLIGIEGIVVDETKNTLKIRGKKNREITIIKSQVTVSVGGVPIDGKKLAKRIEERMKK